MLALILILAIAVCAVFAAPSAVLEMPTHTEHGIHSGEGKYFSRTNSNGDNLGDIKFSISVKDISNALSHNHSNPVEKLICDKILAIFAFSNITIHGGSLVYDAIGAQLEVNSDCSHTVWLEQGWETKATLKPNTRVTVDFRRNHFTIIVEADLLLNCDFHVFSHIRLREGIHDPFDHHNCKDLATETTSGTVGGDMKLRTNLTLELKPKIVHKKNSTTNRTHYGLAFAPTVHLAGKLAYFHPTASSSVKIFGIDIKFIEDDINKYIESAMSKEVSQHQIQKEFKELQAKLQALANKIWNPTSAIGDLPDIDTNPKYLKMIESAVTKISRIQKK